jgi:hypothetical protein
VAFADLADADLAGTLLLQLPWAVLAYEHARAVLRHARPAVLCLYAESSGWGRAALAACAAEGVPSLAVQRHPVSQVLLLPPRSRRGRLPRPPPCSAAAARRFLVERGGYAPDSLVLTGSPEVRRAAGALGTLGPAALRRRFAVADDESLLVVASRFQPIRDTHHAIGPALPALLRAVEAMVGVRCVIKPHPAEPAAPYEAALQAAGATRTRVLPPSADLLELLHASDALVTVESLSAVEALVLGRPVVVLEMPTHLRDLVEAGVALGVPKGRDPAGARWSVLRDPDTRELLADARGRYLSELAMGVDGRATERILALVRDMVAS